MDYAFLEAGIDGPAVPPPAAAPPAAAASEATSSSSGSGPAAHAEGGRSPDHHHHRHSSSSSSSAHRSDRDRDRRHSRSRSPRRDRDRDHHDRRRSRSRSRSPRRDRSDRSDRSRRSRSRSRDRSDRSRRERSPPLSAHDRDARTVLVSQLPRGCSERDVTRHFEPACGRVREVRFITDRNSNRHKGIGYVEFREIDSVDKAIAMDGQRLNGAPLIIRPTMAERNYIAAAKAKELASGATRIALHNLPAAVTLPILEQLCAPFGSVVGSGLTPPAADAQGRVPAAASGWIAYSTPDEARMAAEGLNNMQVADRRIRVALTTAAELHGLAAGVLPGPGGANAAPVVMVRTARALDDDETDRSGVQLTAAGRAELMQRLARSKGLASDLSIAPPSQPPQPPVALAAVARPPVAMPAAAAPQGPPPVAGDPESCFIVLEHMFDPAKETEPGWETDIRDEVHEECARHAPVFHIAVDATSPQGLVYLKLRSPPMAAMIVKLMHGRFFAGQMITARYLPEREYLTRFPAAATANIALPPPA